MKIRIVFSDMPALCMRISALKTSENWAYDLFANVSIRKWGEIVLSISTQGYREAK